MNAKHISIIVAVVALLAGCAKSPIEEVKPSEQLTDLELSRVGAIESKAAIDGTDFPQTGEIGLFLFKDELAETPYGESGYSNVKYAYNSSKSKWTASPSIKVGSDPGYLFGYYPYSSTATDVKEIPVESSLNGDDVMYATKQTVNDKTASQTAITMNHALARVSIKVINNGYTGKAELSKIKFSGAKIAPEGTLNALDGKITATNSNVTLDVPTANQTITATGSTYECLLVPSGEDDNKQTVTLTLTIDGIAKEATLSGDNGVIIAQNTKSNITITLSNKGISIQTVSVEDWNVVEVGGHKVTVKLSEDAGISEDLIVQVTTDGSSVFVKTYSDSKKPLVIRKDDATLVAPTEDGNKSTFTISDISSDITATLAYAKIYKVSASFIADLMPNVDGYTKDFAKEKQLVEGRGDNIVYEVKNVAGYRLDYLVCGETKVFTNKIELKNISSDTEVKAYYTFTDWLKGEFSVSDGKTVRFSRGNLWCDGTETGYSDNYPKIKSWGFESNQYESTPLTVGYRETGHISHFLWCKKAGESVMLRYLATESADDFLFTNSSATTPNDKFAVNGQKGFWRALSGESDKHGEWYYLLFEREGNRFAMAKVHGVEGIVIFPDGYVLPFGYSSESGGVGISKINDAEAGFPGSDIPDETGQKLWSEMEDSGVAFLPAAGIRLGGGDDEMSLKLVNCVGGYYWSSIPSPSSSIASALNFFSNISVALTPRNQACSIRLVTDVK